MTPKDTRMSNFTEKTQNYKKHRLFGTENS